MTSFWQSSSKAQKLAQIDAGISLGLTARQIAINCGTTKDAILYFCRENGRSTGQRSKPQNMSHKIGRIGRRLVCRRSGLPELHDPEAFQIFTPSTEQRLWEAHPHD